MSAVLADAHAQSGDDLGVYEAFYDALGYRFDDRQVLRHALTHRSWCAENPDDPSNERLEFLGDAVLGLVITEQLYNDAPSVAEGSLAKARAEVVSAPTLAAIARHIGLGGLLVLGKGEVLSGGGDKDSILADAMEAVIAAVYIDGGWEAAIRVVRTLLIDDVEQALDAPGRSDYKTRLQELASELGLSAPAYEITATGPDHGRRFNASVAVGTTVGRGSGSSKKQAQQRAAQEAFETLEGMQ